MKKFLKNNIKPYAFILSGLLAYLILELIGTFDHLPWPEPHVRGTLTKIALVLAVLQIGIPFFLFRKDRLRNGRCV